ncbi:hypothetical protein JZU71_02940, partial [bacterium]|nr:hypothetical protein [bacterium]
AREKERRDTPVVQEQDMAELAGEVSIQEGSPMEICMYHYRWEVVEGEPRLLLEAQAVEPFV